MRDELSAIASGAAGRVGVGAMVVATPGLLSTAVSTLKHRSALTTVFVEEGDLMRLLPRLRSGELDLFVGRLEPGYAAPDLQTEPLYDEPMRIVARPGHPLAALARPGWRHLAGQPWVMPPPWASSRVKLEQLFYRHRLDPPRDVVETTSFLATVTFVHERGALAFVASGVARQLEAEGLACTLRIAVPMELPPVGMITMRQWLRTPACALLMDCLRQAAAGLSAPASGCRPAGPSHATAARPTR
jgi:DNA-binding transcriptional LysR family regulator